MNQRDDVGYGDMMGPIDDAIYGILDKNKDKVLEEAEKAKNQPKICEYCLKKIPDDGIEGKDYLEWIDIRPELVGKITYNHINCGKPPRL